MKELENQNLSGHEAKVDFARAYPKTCIGCTKTRTDILLTFTIKNDGSPVFYDMFLNETQARSLVDEIQKRLLENAKS